MQPHSSLPKNLHRDCVREPIYRGETNFSFSTLLSPPPNVVIIYCYIYDVLPAAFPRPFSSLPFSRQKNNSGKITQQYLQKSFGSSFTRSALRSLSSVSPFKWQPRLRVCGPRRKDRCVDRCSSRENCNFRDCDTSKTDVAAFSSSNVVKWTFFCIFLGNILSKYSSLHFSHQLWLNPS